MRITIRTMFALLLTIAAVSARPAFTQNSGANSGAMEKPRFDLALGYSYVHSNAPPGGCGCFNLNGGSFALARPFGTYGFAFAGDIGVTHSGAIAGNGYGLTLSSYTAGIRYTPPLHKPVHPFSQILIGVAHSSGSLVQQTNASVSNAGAAFAALVGGGVDLNAGRRFSIRLVEADYLVTTFDNASNNHQNNLRLNAGVVLHF